MISSLTLPLAPPISVSSGASNELELAGPTIVARHPSADTDVLGPSGTLKIPHSLIVILDPEVLDVTVAVTLSVRSLKVTSLARAGRAKTAATPIRHINPTLTLVHVPPCFEWLSFIMCRSFRQFP